MPALAPPDLVLVIDLGSSGANPFHEGRVHEVHATVDDLGLDGVIAIGGEGTLGSAARLADDGLPVVGIPKTIDNDVPGTDYSIGSGAAQPPFIFCSCARTRCSASGPKSAASNSWRTSTCDSWKGIRRDHSSASSREFTLMTV